MNQIFYKKNFITIVLLTISLIFLYASLIYLIDPLQQYRIAKFLKPVYTNEVYQNPGLAKHYCYDTVIIGSSMVENFRSSYLQQHLGWQTLKLSISGSSPYEEKITLDTAIRTGKVKNVLYGIDVLRLADNISREGFPTYLYSHHSLIDNIKYLLNIGNINFIAKSILKNMRVYSGNNNLDAAYISQRDCSADNVKRDFREQLIHNGEKGIVSLNDMKINFNKNLLTIIHNNPKINFYLFFPPYSIYVFKLYKHKEILSIFLEMKKYILESTVNLPNVKILDFQTEFRITKNLNNYYDLSHYSEQVANYIVDNLQSNKYVLTTNNMSESLNKLSLAV